MAYNNDLGYVALANFANLLIKLIRACTKTTYVACDAQAVLNT